eukprot:11205269-Lingulodinium_polyedra.AAC.1
MRVFLASPWCQIVGRLVTARTGVGVASSWARQSPRSRWPRRGKSAVSSGTACLVCLSRIWPRVWQKVSSSGKPR